MDPARSPAPAPQAARYGVASDPVRSLGLAPGGGNQRAEPGHFTRIILAKLAAHGVAEERLGELGEIGGLLVNWREGGRLGMPNQCPADARIQAFLDRSLAGCGVPVARLPSSTFVLDRHGLARELSLPEHQASHASDILTSYRLGNGVLHNPKNDRRTTQGSFHVAEGGLPVPFDKYAVPLGTFARLLQAALTPPAAHLRLPFTAGWKKPAEIFATLLLRPLVLPAVPGVIDEQRMEIRFIAPGSLVANLDFVESVFGNAGDPYLPENDAGLDAAHWTGHSGCVILAPHLTSLSKQELGLPHVDQATPRQKAEGMCWKDAGERYNGGSAFKITHRGADGVMVTLIADNYFGYCKKEVKTQISFSANLFGLAEEEHSGGALAFPSYHLGDHFIPSGPITAGGHTFADTVATMGAAIEVRPEGYAVLREDPRVLLMAEDVEVDLPTRSVRWKQGGEARSLPLRAGIWYVHPSGYKVRLERHPAAPSWRLVGTWAYGTFCHKPCTVSGGGKSEISKSLADAVIHGPIIVTDVEKDFALVQRILDGDYSERLKPALRPDYNKHGTRHVLSPERSLGSVIKMFTPSGDFTEAYNAWLESIPGHIWPLVFIVKRFHKPEWGTDWRKHFTVDNINGRPGYQLKLGNRVLVGEYLRVGFDEAGAWRTYKLRQDFIPADKVQMEDDITASVVVPGSWIGRDATRSYKLSQNCEHRLFQRPDDAIHRGYDKQTERDMSAPGLFCSNYQPLGPAEVQAEIDDAIRFDQYTEPMRARLRAAGEGGQPFTISSALPRMVDGKPSKNPRYLQVRPDHGDPQPRRLAELGLRLYHHVPADRHLHVTVDSVLCGRRNNPPEPGVRALCVYNPLHYQELPELFMDCVSSLTGKSPSTTGAGSEGALTKGPFNAVRATADLNAALVGMIISGHDGFSSAAGHVGPRGRMDHDISLLVPELWCRLKPAERAAATMIAKGHLERVADITHGGRTARSSRLGWRITDKFLHDFFGRVFDNGTAVFDNALLRPETQDVAVFCDGVDNITAAHTWVAKAYLDDGTVEDACPPLKALLHIMAGGSWQGMDERSPAFRALFSRESLLASGWYKARLEHQQRLDIARWRSHVRYLEAALTREHERTIQRLDLAGRLEHARVMLDAVSAPAWRDRLVGTIGADPTLVRAR